MEPFLQLDWGVRLTLEWEKGIKLLLLVEEEEDRMEGKEEEDCLLMVLYQIQ
jgi:hypothetical protein